MSFELRQLSFHLTPKALQEMDGSSPNVERLGPQKREGSPPPSLNLNEEKDEGRHKKAKNKSYYARSCSSDSNKPNSVYLNSKSDPALPPQLMLENLSRTLTTAPTTSPRVLNKSPRSKDLGPILQILNPSSPRPSRDLTDKSDPQLMATYGSKV